MTAWLIVEGEGCNCGFGGYGLDSYDETKKRRVGSSYGMEFIAKILSTVGVEKWEDLKGKYIRVEHEGLGGVIIRIGNITKNIWFNPKEDLRWLIPDAK